MSVSYEKIDNLEKMQIIFEKDSERGIESRYNQLSSVFLIQNFFWTCEV